MRMPGIYLPDNAIVLIDLGLGAAFVLLVGLMRSCLRVDPIWYSGEVNQRFEGAIA